MLRISIIIPVYNADSFLKEAVFSALQQPETAEVILIEDGSSDDSLKVCQNLAEQYDQVKLFQHPQGVNLGAGASRNLGIEKASSDWIAFLDADDYYLPKRFHQLAVVLNQRPEVGGFYEAVGFEFRSEEDRRNFFPQNAAPDLVQIGRTDILPKELFRVLTTCRRASVHLNGLSIQKKLTVEIGGFSEKLRQTQDTDFIWRASLTGQLYAGRQNEAVAIRRIHGRNRILNRKEALKYRALFARIWFRKMLAENWPKDINRGIFRRLLDSLQRLFPWGKNSLRIPIKIIYGLFLIICYPKLWRKIF